MTLVDCQEDLSLFHTSYVLPNLGHCTATTHYNFWFVISMVCITTLEKDALYHVLVVPNAVRVPPVFLAHQMHVQSQPDHGAQTDTRQSYHCSKHCE